jgi:hypothetical protein
LTLAIKNAPKLYIKVFEINTFNYYKENRNDISLNNIEVDGLIPHYEEQFEYQEPPLLRMERTFTFPFLNNKRGIFIVEVFIFVLLS